MPLVYQQGGRLSTPGVARMPQCAVCCVLCAVCCVLCAVCCVLCAVCCVLCAVCCVLCRVAVCPSMPLVYQQGGRLSSAWCGIRATHGVSAGCVVRGVIQCVQCTRAQSACQALGVASAPHPCLVLPVASQVRQISNGLQDGVSVRDRRAGAHSQRQVSQADRQERRQVFCRL